MGKSGEELYREKEKRINDAIQLKVPDRVPFFPTTGYYAATYAGIPFERAWYNTDRWFEANKRMILDLEPDLASPPQLAIFGSGLALDAVDYKQLKWPGQSLSPNLSHQFVEQEYMKDNEYETFLSDPSDYAIRTYLPRICGTLEPFKMLPHLQTVLWGTAAIRMCAILLMPEFSGALKSLCQAGLETAKWMEANDTFEKEIKELGFPLWAKAITLHPFDFISDMLRGMRGSMLDMFRQPDKLLQMIERLYPRMLDSALMMAKRSGNPRVFIPLHRGADGFMSLEQFEIFYWPFLKRLILDLIDEGLTPCPFFEGVYDQRLHYLKELPKGKVLGMFDRTDIFKAKDMLGDTMCISGNMPSSLIQTGTPEQVKDYAKKLIDVVGKGGGFVMSSATAMDDADPELVKVWKEYTREYGVYK